MTDGDGEHGSGSRIWLWILGIVFGGGFVLVVGLIAAAAVAFGSDSNSGGWFSSAERVGVVEVKGPITESRPTVDSLEDFAEQDEIEGVVVRVDSPGGAVAPSQEIFEAVGRAAEKKPVAVSMANTAASGGYYVSLQADKIFANRGSVTGSIGVISHLFNIEELLDKWNIDVNTLKKGEHKDSGTPFRELSESDREYLEGLLTDIYEQFVDDVAEYRDIERDRLEELADGRVYTGRRAKKVGLVDEVGTFREAIEYVETEAEIDDSDLVYPPEEGNFLSRLLREAVGTTAREFRSSVETPLVEYRMALPGNGE